MSRLTAASLTLSLGACGVPGNEGPTGAGGTQNSTAGMGGTAGAAGTGVGGAATGGSAGTMSFGGVSGSGGIPFGGAAGSAGMGGSAGSGAAGGAAGAAGMGGSAGIGGSAGTTGDACASATICDDFESGTMNAAWGIQPNSVPAPEVDSTKGANGSTSSLKTVGGSQQAFVTLEVPGQTFWVRARMNFERATSEINAHGWYIVAADNVSQGEGAQMRFGSSANHGHNEIDFNVYNGGCSGERTQFSDGASDGLAGWENIQYPVVLLDADTWYCVEALFDSTTHTFQLYLDGVEVPGLLVTEQTMCAAWSPTYTHIKFGAGANGDIGAVWYDDVAVSTSRIGGCN